MGKIIFKDYIKYVSLSVLGILGISLYILVDTFFISHQVGSLGIAALNFSIPLYSVIFAIGLMIGIGGATRFSILKAQNEYKKGNVVFSHCLILGITIGLLLALVGIFFSRQIAMILGADETVIEMTNTYLSTVLCFSPFFIVNSILLAFLRNDNNPKLSMNAMLIGSFANIVMDYIFMYPLKMGMFGAAFATGVAPIISICLMCIHFAKKLNTFKFIKVKMRLLVIVDIIRLGLAMFITDISQGIVLVTFNLIIFGIEGNQGVVSYGIVVNLSIVGMAIFAGIAQGIQPLVSKSHGTKDKETLKRLVLLSVLTSIILSALIYLFSYIYTDSIVKIFNSEGVYRVATLAKNGIRIYFIGFFFAGINIVLTTYLNSSEMTKNAFVISVLRGSIILIPMVFLLGSLWGMNGVYLSFVVTECIVMFITLLFYKKSKASKY